MSRDKHTASENAFYCHKQIGSHPAFENITVGSRLQGRCNVIFFLVHAEKYDFRRTPDISYFQGRVHAVHFRHRHIQEQNIGIESMHRLHCASSVTYHGNDIELRRKQP